MTFSLSPITVRGLGLFDVYMYELPCYSWISRVDLAIASSAIFAQYYTSRYRIVGESMCFLKTSKHKLWKVVVLELYRLRLWGYLKNTSKISSGYIIRLSQDKNNVKINYPICSQLFPHIVSIVLI